MKTESGLMRLCRAVGADSLAWAIRKFHTPVSKQDLVLEVGSGGDPYPRANVLLDAYESTRERHWVPLLTDRPTVLGFVENLPFKDKSFDFVIASHVLEHSSDPARFLSELQRVSKAGYIEVPDAFLERINPYKDHRLEVYAKNDELVISKKGSWIVDHTLVSLYEERVKKVLTADLIPRHPFEFHTRFYWSGEIKFVITNPGVDAGWEAPSDSSRSELQRSFKQSIKGALRKALNFFFSQRARNKKLNLDKFLKCSVCGSESLTFNSSYFECSSCSTRFAVRGNIIDMMK